MNIKQIYAASTQPERIHTAFQMIKRVEARRAHQMILRWPLRDRRHYFPAHFIGDQRKITFPNALNLLLFAGFMIITSIGVWMFVIGAPATIAAPVLFVHVASLWFIMLVKPHFRFQPA
jgi:hypothetical protein